MRVKTSNNSSRKKLARFICELIAYLVLLEIGLRVGGGIFVTLQNYHNAAARQKGTYRIMCLGNSTTALGGSFSYPSQIEKILNQRNIGIKFSVINKGVPGIKTAFILSHLEKNLVTYHPDMVITMMGTNDQGVLYYKDTTEAQAKLSYYCKTYKLIRLLWLHIFAKTEGECAYKKSIELNPNDDRAYLELGLFYRNQSKLDQAEGPFKRAIALNPNDDRAYLELGSLYREQRKISQSEDAYKKVIELNPKSDSAYIGLGWIYRDQGKPSQAEDSFKKAAEVSPYSDRAYGALSVVYEETGKPELAKEYTQKADSLRLKHYGRVATNSYRELKDILDKMGIRLVCVQYPLRNIESLKKIFQGQEGTIIFVDNEQIFKDAVKKEGYNTYFVDMFAGDFGHCTPKGNRLLAENIANAILREAFHQ